MSQISDELNYDNPSDWLAFCTQQILKGLYVCLPATVQSFDAASRRARLRIALDRVATDGSTFSYPTLIDVPVLFPSGGGYTLLMPLAEGDAVLVVFSQRDISEFKQTYETATPNIGDFFSLKDGVAIAGFGDLSVIPAASDAISLQSNDGTTSFTLKNEEVTITSTTVTIKGNLIVDGGVTWTGTAQGSGGTPAQFNSGITNTGGALVSNGVDLDTHFHSVPQGGNTGGPQS
jgi:phage baseplate assembly protein gpV